MRREQGVRWPSNSRTIRSDGGQVKTRQERPEPVEVGGRRPGPEDHRGSASRRSSCRFSSARNCLVRRVQERERLDEARPRTRPLAQGFRAGTPVSISSISGASVRTGSLRGQAEEDLQLLEGLERLLDRPQVALGRTIVLASMRLSRTCAAAEAISRSTARPPDHFATGRCAVRIRMRCANPIARRSRRPLRVPSCR